MTAAATRTVDRQAQIEAAALTDGAGGERHGRDYCLELARITDRWVIELFEQAIADHPTKARVALLAGGGYGRGKLAPYSDLDLILVHDAKPKKVASQIEPIASAIWYPLWDAKVKLGHAVRRVDEQVEMISGDLDSATALLTARYLAGDQELAEEVMRSGLESWERQRSRFLRVLRERMLARQAESADVAYTLEPDLKAGHGGLRDVQTVWWAMAGGLEVRSDDLDDLDGCYDVLLRARVALHRATGRPGDIMRLEDQDAVAAAGGWADADALMADVAGAGRTISWLCDENWSRAVAPNDEPDRQLSPAIAVHDGEIELSPDADPASDTSLVLKAAIGAARTRVRIGRTTLDRLAAETQPWEGDWPVGAADLLVAFLLEGHHSIPVFEALDQRGLVTRFLPEWEPNRSRPQRNAYHRFTVDRHLWEATANAAELVDTVDRPDLLVLGALFHDIGKGYPGDHTEVGMELVADIAPRLGYDKHDVETLVAMVEHHLLLPDVAMRRDISDPATTKLIADLVGDVGRLELLHALTIADSKATGPSAWNSWKEGLVAELVERTKLALGGEDEPVRRWQLFPDADTVAVMALGELHIDRSEDRITVVNPDSSGTFSQIAGVLTLHGLDVLSATAHSDELGMAASQFAVDNMELVNWRSLKSDLRKGVDHELALDARLAERAKTYRRRRRTAAAQPGPPKVKFIDGGSSNATLIEVRAENKVGTLHAITKALTEMGLDIRHATVQTIGMEVVDTFYVRTRSGELVTSGPHRKEIQRAILHAVG